MTKRYRKQDWIELGLTLLAERGEQALTLEAVCAAAGKTRGSFYHHFNDIDGYLEAILAYWRQRDTEDIAALVEAMADPMEAEAKLNGLVIRVDHRLENAIRHMARKHDFAARFLAEIDTRRIGVLERIHRAKPGMTEGEARNLARLEYAAFVGAQCLWPDAVKEELVALGDLFSALTNKN